MDNTSSDKEKETPRDEAPEENEPTFIEDDSPNQMPPKDVVAYNELRSCADLVRFLKRNRLFTDPDFQRDFVWKNKEQTLFIDSLIKGLPIPSMCIALDRETGERIVIDGQQRMSTIVRFLEQEEKPWRLLKLDDIDPVISGKTTKQIKENNPEYFDLVEEHSLPITVLHCELGKKDHMNYIFHIFHRLNSGGQTLKNQEIRNCIFGGPLNKLLRTLDQEKEWRLLNRMKDGNNYRFVKQELILRFFAFFYQGKEYKGGLANFLNNFMDKHRNDDDESLEEMKKIFKRVVSILLSIFDNREPPRSIPANVLHPIMIGFARNIDASEKLQLPELKKRYENLINHDSFTTVKEGLSGAKKIHDRIQAAEDTFGNSL